MTPLPVNSTDYDCILFDMDGTLVNSEVIAHSVLAAHLAEFNYDITPAKCVERFAGRNLGQCFTEIGAERGQPLPGDFEAEFRHRCALAFRKDLQAFDGVHELLRSVWQKIAVASNGPRHKIDLNLSLSGLAGYFGDNIFSAYEVGSWKPDPGLFLAAANSFDVDPANCLVVEDTLSGLLAARAAGMQVVIYSPHGIDPSLPADTATFDHYDKLLKLFIDSENKPWQHLC
jgi:HAD superfamily hydrolase (TIGR01509 family)